MNLSILWDITPCNLFKVNRRFGGICHLHLQGRKISEATKQAQYAISFIAGFLIILFFEPQDKDMFLQNVG
jgi:hypothetical protein